MAKKGSAAGCISVSLFSSHKDVAFCQVFERANVRVESACHASLADDFEIKVKLPRGHFTFTVQHVDKVPGLRQRVPGAKPNVSAIHVTLEDGYNVAVEGFRKEFSNPDHPCDGWLNQGRPMVDGKTLLEVLDQREFFFVASMPDGVVRKMWGEGPLPPPFKYDVVYGTNHSWDTNRAQEQWKSLQGGPFRRSITFDDINERTAVQTQAVIQDNLWVARAAAEIFATTFPAYFVPGFEMADETTRCTEYFAVIRLSDHFKAQFEEALEVLCDGEFLHLAFHEHGANVVVPELDHDWKEVANDACIAKIVSHPSSAKALAQHPTNDEDLVLYVNVGKPKNAVEQGFQLPTFPDRTAANKALAKNRSTWAYVSLLFDAGLEEDERKVNATCQLLPGADLTHYKKGEADADSLAQLMELHRRLHLGTGFHEFLKGGNARYDPQKSVVQSMKLLRLDGDKSQGCALPVVDMLSGCDISYLEGLLKNVPLQDHVRFMKYFGNRPLGLALITAGPGFGKTTALSVVTLSLCHSVGRVLASAPSNSALTNFAKRLVEVENKTVAVCNEGKEENARIRRKLVIRAHNLNDEIRAFQTLLKMPGEGDKAAPNHKWRPESKWHAHLSPAWYLLGILRSPAGHQIERDDNSALAQLQSGFDANLDLQSLRDVAEGKITWSEFEGNVFYGAGKVRMLLEMVIAEADILCVTPSISEKPPFKLWKACAKGVAVDEAGFISRPDLDCVWGNTLLPCILAGDERQFQPLVRTSMQRQDSVGRTLNWHAADGDMSPMNFFKITGVAVYVLRIQYRMADDLFALCGKFMYSDVDYVYHESCLPFRSPQHQIGRTLEDFALAALPGLKKYDDDRLRPFFVHCHYSRAIRARGSHSTLNPEQNRVALRFLAEFVCQNQVDPSRIKLITPYRANRDDLELLRKKGDYLVLAGMEPVATVDSFQGCEGDIVVAVMATSQRTGPGFTRDENRINVLLSRQKSGLVIVGDINMVGKVFDAEKEVKAKRKAKGKITVVRTKDKTSFVKAEFLVNVCHELVKSGRVVQAPAEWQAKETKVDE
ncbi:unnamed protein product [Clonostachys rosea]|uniref:DNA2/NAM7 helicase-like C-terminal domain-containing protein n=1 Tax=Bionectria ochroleuca TaxID=29856 RepID=A0ABY6UAI3_BIOOC|nr:unnamed protein product [Clonostachys rosea]